MVDFVHSYNCTSWDYLSNLFNAVQSHSSSGLNGLIFYANIVRLSQAVFFSSNSNNSFLGWFIVWVNLDLGIEACFYNGMDAYAKT